MAAGKDGLLSFDAWVPLPQGAKTLPLLWALGDDWTQPPKEVARVRWWCFGRGVGAGWGVAHLFWRQCVARHPSRAKANFSARGLSVCTPLMHSKHTYQCRHAHSHHHKSKQHTKSPTNNTHTHVHTHTHTHTNGTQQYVPHAHPIPLIRSTMTGPARPQRLMSQCQGRPRRQRRERSWLRPPTAPSSTSPRSCGWGTAGATSWRPTTRRVRGGEEWTVMTADRAAGLLASWCSGC
jgi:hypothetical protein